MIVLQEQLQISFEGAEHWVRDILSMKAWTNFEKTKTAWVMRKDQFQSSMVKLMATKKITAFYIDRCHRS